MDYKKPKFWIPAILIALSAITTVIWLIYPKTAVQDLSFLKPDNLKSVIAEKERIPVKNHGGTTYLQPYEVIAWIESVEWKEKKVKSPYELSADYTIVFNTQPKQEIRLYDNEPTLVMVIYDDTWRYYTISQKDYEDIWFRIMTKSYFEPDEAGGDSGAVDNLDAAGQVERYLNEIMSSPKEASDSGAYISEHQQAYESIVKLGEPALVYMLAEFQKGNQTGLKGALMKELCADMLGNRAVDRGTVYSSGQEWYDNLDIQQEVMLPPFTIERQDPIEQLAYDAAMMAYPSYSVEGNQGLCVVALKIHDSSQEGGKLRIFATVYYESYRFYGTRLIEESAGIVPTAITYVMDSDENYSLEEYLESEDGGMWQPSIEAFCVTPTSGKTIKGLTEKIIDAYGDHSELFEIEKDNLREYLISNRLIGVEVIDSSGNAKTME